MPVFNYGEIFSSLFTWIKLGISITLLVFLATKFMDGWEDIQQDSELQNQTEEVIRY